MLKGLDHFNISTSDMPATLAFFEELFGMTGKPAPGQDGARNSWLYDQAGRPLVHVNLREAAADDGPINHVAFACEGYDAMREKLIAAGHQIKELDNRHITGARQIFLRGTEGALIELTFHGD